MSDTLNVRADTVATVPCACCRPPSDAASEIQELEAQRALVERRLAELSDPRG